MTINFKSRDSLVLPVYSQKSLNIPKKVKFCCGDVTNCIPCVVYLVYFILLHVNDYNGTTRKPHDHLFQKSGQLGHASLLPAQEPQNPKK